MREHEAGWALTGLPVTSESSICGYLAVGLTGPHPAICLGLAITYRPVTCSVIWFLFCLSCLSRLFIRFLSRSLFRCIISCLLLGLDRGALFGDGACRAPPCRGGLECSV